MIWYEQIMEGNLIPISLGRDLINALVDFVLDISDYNFGEIYYL